MNIVTTPDNAIAWDEIDPLTKNKIINYYQSMWKNSGERLCSKNISLIKELHRKACLSSRLKMAYIAIECVKCSEDDTFKNIIKGIPIEHILSQYIEESKTASTNMHPLTYQTLEKLLGETILAHKNNNGNIVVISGHSGDFQDFCSSQEKLFYEESEYEEESFLICQDSPVTGVVFVLDPLIATEIKERNDKRESKNQKPKKATEQSREDSLYDWLRMQGIEVERQVKTSSNHVIDLWIPDKMMIEVKRSSVSGNDICQCIEYASEYRLPIVLVGDKVSGAASRGIKGFNKLCPKNKILFISWDAIHDFLKGRFNV